MFCMFYVAWSVCMCDLFYLYVVWSVCMYDLYVCMICMYVWSVCIYDLYSCTYVYSARALARSPHGCLLMYVAWTHVTCTHMNQIHEQMPKHSMSLTIRLKSPHMAISHCWLSCHNKLVGVWALVFSQRWDPSTNRMHSWWWGGERPAGRLGNASVLGRDVTGGKAVCVWVSRAWKTAETISRFQIRRLKISWNPDVSAREISSGVFLSRLTQTQSALIWTRAWGRVSVVPQTQSRHGCFAPLDGCSEDCAISFLFELIGAWMHILRTNNGLLFYLPQGPHVCVFIYTSTYAHIVVRHTQKTCVCSWLCSYYIYIYIYIYIWLFMYTYRHTHNTRAPTCMFVSNIHMYACNKHTHTHTHTYIRGMQDT